MVNQPGVATQQTSAVNDWKWANWSLVFPVRSISIVGRDRGARQAVMRSAPCQNEAICDARLPQTAQESLHAKYWSSSWNGRPCARDWMSRRWRTDADGGARFHRDAVLRGSVLSGTPRRAPMQDRLHRAVAGRVVQAGARTHSESLLPVLRPVRMPNRPARPSRISRKANSGAAHAVLALAFRTAD